MDTWEYNLVELAPELKSLDLAITQEEYDVQQEALRKQQEEEQAKRLEDKRLAEEAERQARIEAQYRGRGYLLGLGSPMLSWFSPLPASIPDEITRKVNQVVSRYMDEMRAEFDAKLEQKLAELGAGAAK
ncbi:uncharacterized protein LOC112341877 isoform X1 [Selaginella moellendorffii]|uniref:uncharacterized protein LOC112341877 isoform X1 n=1 Tax=Selaginella moellendorffii TaxID=88036 RepID=UPI000D1CDC24|nr:uncharacterized protein LOC112341877 isoform X1 [Selaginella moellendorffii]|eukprot:XP_024518580.1 uncharacterized protein LOC112341877 isoform X1 [Selaginella moellendorffii]